jgi:hypothetical protein
MTRIASIGSPDSGLNPHTGLPPQIPDSERKVYEALAAALPAGWSAWHSLKIRIKGTEFSEADFVIADPARGILVLEVKGGIVRKQDGIWFQNERPMKMPPIDQAHRFVRILLGKYMEHELVPPVIGVAAVFPDTEFESQPTQGDLEGLVLGARELPYMEKLLPGLLERALPAGIRRRPSPEWTTFLHALWCESWPAAMNLSCVVKGREARRVRLDGEQFAALESVIGNDLVLVRGGAGTGKTLLARELARREAGAGRKVLVLTYTEALGLELAANVDGLGITVSPVGRFALERLRRRGFDEVERYEPEFWDRVTRIAAESGALWKDCGFDTVIVDEGQDFGKHEWAIVMRCAETGENGKRRIWVFADEGQAFWEKRKIPPAIEKHAVKFDLGRPYRCPPGIQALAEAYVGKNCDFEAVAGEVADGTIKVIVCGDTEAEAHEAVGREIRALKAEGFAESDIAVVSLRGMMYPGNIMHRKELGGCDLAQATDLAGRDRVVCDTFLRYKGLERPVIIVADVKTEAERYAVRMNIAVSRAFGALRVVMPRREVESDSVLQRALKYG